MSIPTATRILVRAPGGDLIVDAAALRARLRQLGWEELGRGWWSQPPSASADDLVAGICIDGEDADPALALGHDGPVLRPREDIGAGRWQLLGSEQIAREEEDARRERDGPRFASGDRVQCRSHDEMSGITERLPGAVHAVHPMDVASVRMDDTGRLEEWPVELLDRCVRRDLEIRASRLALERQRKARRSRHLARYGAAGRRAAS